MVLGAAALLCGCGATRAVSGAAGGGPLPRDYQPIRTGRTAAYRLPSLSGASVAGRPVAGLACTGRHPSAYGIHLELYARRLVVPIPAGIGVAAPQRRQGVYVRGGRCTYPLRTFEPTGVFVVDRVRRPPVLGMLFAVWGQPLSARRLAGFRGTVSAFVGGRRWLAPATAIPLSPHAEIVLEVGGHVIPHPAYSFPPGL